MVTKYKAKPVEVEAEEIVHVVEYDWDGCHKVKIKNGGRLYSAESMREPYKGDFLIFEKGIASDGYVCPREVFLSKYEVVVNGKNN